MYYQGMYKCNGDSLGIWPLSINNTNTNANVSANIPSAFWVFILTYTINLVGMMEM